MLLSAMVFLQGLIGRTGLLCIGLDHVGLPGEHGHGCCEHEDGDGWVDPVVHISHDECECIDVGMPRGPMQLKRGSIAADVAAPLRALSPFGSFIQSVRLEIRARDKTTNSRHLRTVVLLI